MFRNKDNRHIVSIRDFSQQDLIDFLDITKKIKADPGSYSEVLKGKKMATLFYNDSTRTYETHKEAMWRLGGEARMGFRNPQGTSVKKGETLKSTIHMYERWKADVIVLRYPNDGAAVYASEVAKKAWIINGGDGNNEHPTQNLLDLFTINENQHRLEDLTILFFGDLKYGRTTRLVYPMSLWPNNKYVFLTHPMVGMPDHVKDFLKQNGGEFEEYSDPKMFTELIHNCDIAYGSRNQEERWPGEKTNDGKEMRREVRNDIVLTKGTINRADPRKNFIVMHPLPKDQKYPCITDDVEETPYCWYDPQAENGIPSRMGYIFSQFKDWWVDG
jgi:aspartate carbamoyltransferase catalytic subunit